MGWEFTAAVWYRLAGEEPGPKGDDASASTIAGRHMTTGAARPVAVIGGGVVGLCCAWSLQRRGFEVVVLERGELGSGASAVNAGWVSPSLSTPLAAPGILRTGLRHALDPNGALVIRPTLDLGWARWLWRFRQAARPAAYRNGVRALLRLNARTLDLFDQLAAEGVQFEMHPAGVLAVAFAASHLAWFTQLFGELRELGFSGGIIELTPAEAVEREPAIGEAVRAAVLTTVDRHVRPDSLTAGLGAWLRAAGTTVLDRTAVRSLQPGRDGWVITTNGTPLTVRAVVLALGAASNHLLTPLGVRLPVMGAKGYSVDVRGTGTTPCHALYLMEPKLGLSPFETALRIAGVFELPGRDAVPAPRRVRQLVSETVPYLRDWRPAAERYELRGRAGLRPATPDSLPFIGPVPGLPGLYVATGHGMLGVTLAPATGEAVGEMVERQAVPEWLLPFQLAGRV